MYIINIFFFFRNKKEKVLNVKETLNFLKPRMMSAVEANSVLLPDIKNADGSEKLIFYQKTAIADQAFTWHYKRKSRLLPNGGVKIGTKVLCLDFNQDSFYKKQPDNVYRAKYKRKALIAPFSQYLDGVNFVGYYDFVFFVAAKICRIKDNTPINFEKATVAYPLFNTCYEDEFMKLLDVKAGNLMDSAYADIKAKQTFLANAGHWFYPNAADISSLKKHIESRLQIKKTASNRIYISRACRRKINNENELICMLKKFDFTIIEDKPRSVAEQVEIYKNASFIIGPHGASFTNIIWCEPGTHLFELFSPNYVPDFFLYLTKIMSMQYSAYYNTADRNDMTTKERISDNINVSILAIEKSLRALLQQSQVQ